jgi:hypothetical protein
MGQRPSWSKGKAFWNGVRQQEQKNSACSGAGLARHDEQTGMREIA